MDMKATIYPTVGFNIQTKALGSRGWLGLFKWNSIRNR